MYLWNPHDGQWINFDTFNNHNHNNNNSNNNDNNHNIDNNNRMEMDILGFFGKRLRVKIVPSSVGLTTTTTTTSIDWKSITTIPTGTMFLFLFR